MPDRLAAADQTSLKRSKPRDYFLDPADQPDKARLRKSIVGVERKGHEAVRAALCEIARSGTVVRRPPRPYWGPWGDMDD